METFGGGIGLGQFRSSQLRPPDWLTHVFLPTPPSLSPRQVIAPFAQGRYSQAPCIISSRATSLGMREYEISWVISTFDPTGQSGILYLRQSFNTPLFWSALAGQLDPGMCPEGYYADQAGNLAITPQIPNLYFCVHAPGSSVLLGTCSSLPSAPFTFPDAYFCPFPPPSPPPPPPSPSPPMPPSPTPPPSPPIPPGPPPPSPTPPAPPPSARPTVPRRIAGQHG